MNKPRIKINIKNLLFSAAISKASLTRHTLEVPLGLGNGLSRVFIFLRLSLPGEPEWFSRGVTDDFFGDDDLGEKAPPNKTLTILFLLSLLDELDFGDHPSR